MLPSLSLLHPPLSPQQHLDLMATSSRTSSSSRAGITGSVLRALPLPRPNVLVGYEVGAAGISWQRPTWRRGILHLYRLLLV